MAKLHEHSFPLFDKMLTDLEPMCNVIALVDVGSIVCPLDEEAIFSRWWLSKSLASGGKVIVSAGICRT